MKDYNTIKEDMRTIREIVFIMGLLLFFEICTLLYSLDKIPIFVTIILGALVSGHIFISIVILPLDMKNYINLAKIIKLVDKNKPVPKELFEKAGYNYYDFM